MRVDIPGSMGMVRAAGVRRSCQASVVRGHGLADLR